MTVFRISLAKYAILQASGRAARWNSNGIFVIYTSSSRALACLENVVHRDSIGLNGLFKVLTIKIPDNLAVETINGIPDLDSCKLIGDNWYKKQESCILKVPSIIIEKEYNYLINTQHSDFQKIKLKAIENFSFDSRIKTN